MSLNDRLPTIPTPRLELRWLEARDVPALYEIFGDPETDPRNDASIRRLERLGFQREGYLRERYHLGGEVQDALLYGLLRSSL